MTIPRLDAPAGLVSWWTGDCDARDLLEDNHGVLLYGAQAGVTTLTNLAPAEVIGAFEFDGVDDGIIVPYSPTLDFSDTDFSVVLWFNMPFSATSPTGEFALMTTGSTAVGGSGWHLILDLDGANKFLIGNINNGSGGAALINIVIPDPRDDDWHQLAVTFDRDGYARTYFDGIPKGDRLISGEAGGAGLGTDQLLIGKLASTRQFIGGMDEIQLYDTLLTDADVAAIYAADSNGVCKAVDQCALAPLCIVPDDDLVAWWTGDTDASDAVNGNDGVLQNGALAGQPGLSDGAFQFDGSDDFVQIAHGPPLEFTGDLTISAWINCDPGTVSGDVTVINKGSTNTAGQGFVMLLNFSGANKFVTVRLNSGVGGPIDLSGVMGGDIRDGQWHHVAATLDRDGNGNVFLDGQIIRTLPIVAEAGSLGTGIITIGTLGLSNTRFFNGLIDEVQLYSRVLAPDEIGDLITARGNSVCKNCQPCDDLISLAYDQACLSLQSVPTRFDLARALFVEDAAAVLSDLRRQGTYPCPDDPGGSDCVQYMLDAFNALIP